MKKILCILSLFCLLSIGIVSVSYAETVRLLWNANPPEQLVDLYQVEIDGQLIADVVGVSYVLNTLQDGQHTARVRAHNNVGWGDFSAMLEFTLPLPLGVPPNAPTGLRIEPVSPNDGPILMPQ